MSKEKVVFKSKWIACLEDEQGFLFMSMPDGVLIVPVTAEGEIVLITEYSPAFQKRILFLPGGAIDPGEDSAETANRELQEEAGFKAGRLELLGVLHPMIKYLRANLYIYLAQDLVASQLSGDEPWEIGIERMPLADLDQLLSSDRVSDSNVIAALYMARKVLVEAER